MKLTYHRAVQDEVDEACAWYDERKNGLGDENFASMKRAMDAISINPQAFPLASAGRRKAHLKRFPYTIYYRAMPTVCASFLCVVTNGIRAMAALASEMGQRERSCDQSV